MKVIIVLSLQFAVFVVVRSEYRKAVLILVMPIRQDLAPTPNNTLYLFVKVDNDTSNPIFTGSQIVWQE